MAGIPESKRAAWCACELRRGRQSPDRIYRSTLGRRNPLRSCVARRRTVDVPRKGGSRMIGASFDSSKTPLHELLGRADNGKLQLPDFQREWVWDDERIRSLLASVSVSFPIGAVMLLETGGRHVRFKPRPLAGTHERIREVAPETLILDGQQRLTSLYRALMGGASVDTKDAKGKPIRRWYYIDM